MNSCIYIVYQQYMVYQCDIYNIYSIYSAYSIYSKYRIFIYTQSISIPVAHCDPAGVSNENKYVNVIGAAVANFNFLAVLIFDTMMLWM